MESKIYQQVTDRIIAQLESGTAPWQQSWKDAKGPALTALQRPLRSTGQPYTGINVVNLWCAAQARGFGLHHWMTYKTATELGGQVKKGAKAELAFYVGRHVVDRDQETEREISFLRCYSVFNADEIDGLPDRYHVRAEPTVFDARRVGAVDAFVANTGADIAHGGNRAFYSRAMDVIRMPALAQFDTLEAYYATLLHELTHWTSAPDRCARQLGKRFGDDEYAAEELVAELGAAFLCADLALSAEPRGDHASYIAGWLKILRGDNRAIFKAATLADKAAAYLHELQPAAPRPAPIAPVVAAPISAPIADPGAAPPVVVAQVVSVRPVGAMAVRVSGLLSRFRFRLVAPVAAPIAEPVAVPPAVDMPAEPVAVPPVVAAPAKRRTRKARVAAPAAAPIAQPTAAPPGAETPAEPVAAPPVVATPAKRRTRKVRVAESVAEPVAAPPVAAAPRRKPKAANAAKAPADATPLRTEIERLQEQARSAARGRVHARIGGLAMSTRFAPSRLEGCPRDRAYLAKLYREAEAVELALRGAQIDRLRRKIDRITHRNDGSATDRPTPRAKAPLPAKIRDYDSFVAHFVPAKEAAMAEHGPSWRIKIGVPCRLPAAWVACKVFNRTSRAPRDTRLPPAQYWPTGTLPVGPAYEADYPRETGPIVFGDYQTASDSGARYKREMAGLAHVRDLPKAA